MGLVLQQVTETACSEVGTVRSLLQRVIGDKHEDVMARFGALLATGLIDAGVRTTTVLFFFPPDFSTFFYIDGDQNMYISNGTRTETCVCRPPCACISFVVGPEGRRVGERSKRSVFQCVHVVLSLGEIGTERSSCAAWPVTVVKKPSAPAVQSHAMPIAHRYKHIHTYTCTYIRIRVSASKQVYVQLGGVYVSCAFIGVARTASVSAFCSFRLRGVSSRRTLDTKCMHVPVYVKEWSDACVSPSCLLLEIGRSRSFCAVCSRVKRKVCFLIEFSKYTPLPVECRMVLHGDVFSVDGIEKIVRYFNWTKTR